MANRLWRLPIALLVFMFMTSDAWAEDINWFRVSANSLIIADWIQTQEISADPKYIELNKHLGTHPTNREINQYFLANLLITNIVGELLPKEYSETFYLIIAVNSSYYVVNNHMLFMSGVKISF